MRFSNCLPPGCLETFDLPVSDHVAPSLTVSSI